MSRVSNQPIEDKIVDDVNAVKQDRGDYYLQKQFKNDPYGGATLPDLSDKGPRFLNNKVVKEQPKMLPPENIGGVGQVHHTSIDADAEIDSISNSAVDVNNKTVNDLVHDIKDLIGQLSWFAQGNNVKSEDQVDKFRKRLVELDVRYRDACETLFDKETLAAENLNKLQGGQTAHVLKGKTLLNRLLNEAHKMLSGFEQGEEVRGRHAYHFMKSGQQQFIGNTEADVNMARKGGEGKGHDVDVKDVHNKNWGHQHGYHHAPSRGQQ